MFAERLITESETNPSRPIPIYSMLFPERFKCSNLSRVSKPWMVEIWFSSSQSFSSMTHFSSPVVLVIRLYPKYNSLIFRILSKPLIESNKFYDNHAFSRFFKRSIPYNYYKLKEINCLPPLLKYLDS